MKIQKTNALSVECGTDVYLNTYVSKLVWHLRTEVQRLRVRRLRVQAECSDATRQGSCLG